MTTAAIYTVRQNAQESNYYSFCAGGYSYPFYIADWLHQADQDLNHDKPDGEKQNVAALLPQFTGNYSFPKAAKGLHLFRSISNSAAADFLARTNENERSPFHITIDMDRESVRFEFHPNCSQLDLPNVELPVAYIKNETSYEWEESSSVDAELNEFIYEQLIRNYIVGQIPQNPEQNGTGMAIR